MDEFLEANELLFFSLAFLPLDKEICDAKERMCSTVSKTEVVIWKTDIRKKDEIYLISNYFQLPNGAKHGGYTANYLRLDLDKTLKCTFIDGLLQGSYTIKRSNGTIALEAEFLDGEPHGYCTLWSKMGILKRRYSLKRGALFAVESGKIGSSSLRCTSKDAVHCSDRVFGLYFPITTQSKRMKAGDSVDLFNVYLPFLRIPLMGFD